MPSNSDLGVVLYASGDGSGSYTTRAGTSGTVRTLTAQNYIASDWFDVGRLADLFLTISGVISVQMASAVVLIERRRRDLLNQIAFQPAVIGSVRLDQPSSAKATTQTILRADLVGQDVSAWPNVVHATETLDVVLFTTDHRWAGECRVLVKATNAPANSDKIIIAANGGG